MGAFKEYPHFVKTIDQLDKIPEYTERISKDEHPELYQPNSLESRTQINEDIGELNTYIGPDALPVEIDKLEALCDKVDHTIFTISREEVNENVRKEKKKLGF